MIRTQSGLIVPNQPALVVPGRPAPSGDNVVERAVEIDRNKTMAEEAKIQADRVEIIRHGFRLMVELGWSTDEVINSIREACPDLNIETSGMIRESLTKMMQQFLGNAAGLGMAWEQYSLAWRAAFPGGGTKRTTGNLRGSLFVHQEWGRNWALACWGECRLDRWENHGFGLRKADLEMEDKRVTKLMPTSMRAMRPRKNVDLSGSRMRRLIRQSKPKDKK